MSSVPATPVFDPPTSAPPSAAIDVAPAKVAAASKPAPAPAPTPSSADVGESLQRGATQLAGALGSGFRAAHRSLAESSPGALEAALSSAPSVDLVGTDSLPALSARLAAESDFWRRLGLQSLSRAIVADRVGYAVAALGVLSGLGLTVVAGFGGLFGGEHAGGKAALLLVGAAIVLCVSAIAFTFTHVIRRSQRDAVNAAFARADLAEKRLHGLALAVALRESAPEAFREALERLRS
jgi:hypothetical protein